MRKLSCKWPMYLTLFAMSSPAFYLLFRIGKPEILNITVLGEKILGALGIALIVWLLYGVSCLLAAPRRAPSATKPREPSDDFNSVPRPTPEAHQPTPGNQRNRVPDSEQKRTVTPVSEFVEKELEKSVHKKSPPTLKSNTEQAASSRATSRGSHEVGISSTRQTTSKRLKRTKKWLLIIVIFATVSTISLWGGFFIVKNKVSAYLEKAVEQNPLFFAVAGGNSEQVNRLLSEGANPNVASINGHTPLIAATRGHHTLIAEKLLLSGANPDQRDNFGWAALHHAITPVDGADLDLISILVKHGANVNIQDNRQRTPLHRAAQYGQLQAVLLLLKLGADPNIRDYNGWIAADRAVLHPETQSLLVSKKSNSDSEVSEFTKFPEYISEKHNFKVRFPGKPKVVDYGLVTHYTVEIEQEGAYNIIINDLPKPVLGDEVIKGFLDGHLQGRLALFGDKATVLQSQQVLFLGYKALQYEYVVESQDASGYFKGTYFLAGKLAYGISAVCTEESKPLVYPKYRDFLESFRLVGSH